jgi:hypothetical protein
VKPLLIILLIVTTAAARPPKPAKPIVRNGYVMRTIQQDAELKEWIMGLQLENQHNIERAEAAEQSQKQVEASLSRSVVETGKLENEIKSLTDWANKMADSAAYWKGKHKEALAKLWWWRICGGGAISIGSILITIGILTKFTAWGARTFGPLIRPI